MTRHHPSRAFWAAVIGVALLTLIAFGKLGSHEFIAYDDVGYVLENPMVESGLSWRGVRWAFSTTAMGNWHPLTWLSHQLDVSLFGLVPGRHHLVSLMLHLGSAELLLTALLALTGSLWPGALVAAMFAAHPLHVESVAWIAERKDVLSGLFFMLTLLAYARYVSRPGLARYLGVTLLFVLGLMAKPMVMTLPLVLLVIDWWPLGRFRARRHETSAERRLRLIIPAVEKLPLLGVSIASGIVALKAQSGSLAMLTLAHVPMAERPANAAVAYAAYLQKTLWPDRLAVFYPLPAGGWPWWKTALAVTLLAGISLAVFLLRAKRPFLAAGWLFYLVTLVPVIGLVQIGRQAMADRYTYLPLAGIFVMAAWGLTRAGGHRRLSGAVVGATLAVLLMMSLAARRQTGYWRDSIALFEHALEVTENNYLAHNNLATVYRFQGKLRDAVYHYTEALRINPTFTRVRVNLGNVLLDLGETWAAGEHLREAVRLSPGFPPAWRGLGRQLLQEGNPRAALACYLKALRIRPDDREAKLGAAACLEALGRGGEAEGYYREVLASDPASPEAGRGLVRLGASGNRR